ncbi:hypothetical protein INR49_027343 [Caranx melampygus]|nr:hypothetical protein INR49_027343 [Caranx melampygus]
MEAECKVQLDASVATEDRKHTTQGFRPSSALCTALLMFTLCLAAAAAALLIFNSNTKGLRQDEDDFDLRHTLRQISDGRAAIHLEGKRGKTSVQWNANVDHAHSHGGLKLVNNEIEIPSKGLYFVYSQASFSVNCSSSDDDYDDSNSMVHLSHTVKRWSRSFGDYETILHSVRTACQRTFSADEIEDGNWYTAVYMGAVFDLNKGDKLKTVMEEKMLQELQDEAGKTFFGVFAL